MKKFYIYETVNMFSIEFKNGIGVLIVEPHFEIYSDLLLRP